MRRIIGPLTILLAIPLVAACIASPAATTPGASSVPSTSPAPSSSPVASPAASTIDRSDWGWIGAGSLGVERLRTSAVRLGDGSVLVVGAENVCTPGGAWAESKTTERFDPASGTWARTGDLDGPRDGFVLVSLADGGALVAGGVDGENAGLLGAELFDPGDGTWSDGVLPPDGRHGAVGVVLVDGRVLVAGGSTTGSGGWVSLSSALIFDPVSASWSSAGTMEQARSSPAAVRLADGRVLVVGGVLVGLPFDPGPITSAEIFDPATGAWSSAGLFGVARDGFSLVPLDDGGALVLGGRIGGDKGADTVVTSEVMRFDPASGWGLAEPMPTAASNRAAVRLADGTILVAGGTVTLPLRDPDLVPAGLTVSAEVFDPRTGHWTAVAPLPAPRSDATAVLLEDGSALLVGGISKAADMLDQPSCPTGAREVLRFAAP